jgi:hypothetical protein
LEYPSFGLSTLLKYIFKCLRALDRDSCSSRIRRTVSTKDVGIIPVLHERFEATGLGLLATLRADGSPRVSGLEPLFALGELWFGMMPESRKALDLLRDPRFAIPADDHLDIRWWTETTGAHQLDRS